MFDSRTKARSLAFLFAGGAIVGALTLTLPHDAKVDDTAISVSALLAVLCAGVFLRYADRVTDAIVHVTLALAIVQLGATVHYTDQASLYALMYSWPALYAFYFFTTPVALAHLGLIGASYATVLVADDASDIAVRLMLVLGTPLVVGLLLARLLARMGESLRQSARQDRALRTSEERTRVIVDSARDGFVSADADGNILDLNAAAQRLLGRSRAELLGRPFMQAAIPSEHHEAFERRRLALLERARQARGSHIAVDVRLTRPDGAPVHAEAMVWTVERHGEWLFNARLTDIGERLAREQEREDLVRAQAARGEAERATAVIARLQAVADAALTLLDLDALTAEIIVRTRDVLEADSAALMLVRDDGTMSVVRADDIADDTRPTVVPADTGIAGRILAAGGPVIINHAGPEDVTDPAIINAGITSLVGVPLTTLSGKVFGAIGVGVREPRVLGTEDVDLLRLAADRAALAIDHVRAYGREQRIAETLQRSLLPLQLPELPGMALAARYLPAAAEAEVGGDWYDAVPLDSGRVLLVMGDVSGKGLAAAATLGELRNAIRAYALDGHGPAAIAGRLNRLILSDPGREHMTTLVLAVFDPVDGRLRWVNAGHPPPLALDAAGVPRYLEGERAVPLGVLPFPDYADNETVLEPGGALVLYTDGLIERRGEHLDTGLQAAAAAAADGVLAPDALCDRMLGASPPDGGGGDDTAVLALCHVPLGERLALELPSEASALSSLRTLLRRWLEQAHAGSADVHAIVMACSEAATNAIEHAGTGPGARIAFAAHLRDGEVEATIRDRGRWREDRPPSDQGRGLDLIEALMDDVAVDRAPDGTTVTLRRRLRGPASGGSLGSSRGPASGGSLGSSPPASSRVGEA